jgi:hypothetical protein
MPRWESNHKKGMFNCQHVKLGQQLKSGERPLPQCRPRNTEKGKDWEKGNLTKYHRALALSLGPASQSQAVHTITIVSELMSLSSQIFFDLVKRL